MKKLEAVIFDMDGVIVNTGWYWIKILSNIIEDYGYKISKDDIAEISGCSDDYELEILARYIDKDKETLKNIRSEYVSKSRIEYSNHIVKGVIELFKFLKRNNIKMAIASSSSIADINRMLDEVKIREYFDLLISGEMFKETKPNPAIYNETVKQLKIPKENIFVIEDSLYGIQAALRANLDVLVLKTPEYDFSNEDYLVFDSHNEIEQYIINMNFIS